MKKLYLTDSKKITFTATVTSIVESTKQYAITLNETYFFPSGGGQLADTGTINGFQVSGFIFSDEDILHIIDSHLNIKVGDTVDCEIDYRRRYDLMQQHTGQHILSQSILRVLGFDTLSFQMKEDISQIQIPFYDDIDYDELLIKSEQIANEVVFSNIHLNVINIYPSQGAEYNLRKEPLNKYLDDSGKCRVVKIGDFETIPCGGTHCSNTGEVGLIKIIGKKKQNNKLILDFVCGNRALYNFNNLLKTINDICKILNTNKENASLLISKNITELDSLKKERNVINQELLSYKSKEIALSYIQIEKIKVVLKDIPGYDLNDIKFLSKEIVADNDIISLIGNGTNFVISKSNNVDKDIIEIFKKTCIEIPAIGGGKGCVIQGSISENTSLIDFFNLFVKYISWNPQ